MDTAKKSLAVIFAILFVTTAVLSLFAFNFDRQAFSTKTYQTVFANESFYNRLPAMMAEMMTSANADQSKLPIVMQGMTPQAWESFFRAILPPEAFKQIGDDALNSMFAYLTMQTNSAQLSLGPLKTSMVSDAGVQAVFTLLKTQPDCTLMQLGQMALDLFSQQQMLFCNPPAEMIPLLTPIIQGQLQVLSAAIPDQVTLVSSNGINDPRQKLHTVRLIMRLSPLLPLGFLLLLTLFAVNSLKSWLQWWGIPFIITGVTASLMAISGAPVISIIVQRILVNSMPTFLPAILLDFTSQLASAMLQTLLSPVFWQGLVIALIGVVMVAGSFLFEGNKTSK